MISSGCCSVLKGVSGEGGGFCCCAQIMDMEIKAMNRIFRVGMGNLKGW